MRKSGPGGSRPLRRPGRDDLHDKHHVRLRGGIQARSGRRLDPNLSGEQAVEWNTARVSRSVRTCVLAGESVKVYDNFERVLFDKVSCEDCGKPTDCPHA